MTETNELKWLEEEQKQIDAEKQFDGERLPSLKFEQNKITEFEVDFSVPFGTWQGDQGGKKVTKAVIPVIHKEEKKNWWLNKRNPIYKDIIRLGREGKKKFKICQVGTQADTKYNLIQE